MHTISNVQFIATYIYKNPGARYGSIMKALRKWRGREQWKEWGNQYFNSYTSTGYTAQGRYWQKTNPEDRNSGYVLTLAGLTKVCLQNPLPPHTSRPSAWQSN